MLERGGDGGGVHVYAVGIGEVMEVAGPDGGVLGFDEGVVLGHEGYNPSRMGDLVRI